MPPKNKNNCDQCKDSFPTKQKLQQHIKSKHKKNIEEDDIEDEDEKEIELKPVDNKRKQVSIKESPNKKVILEEDVEADSSPQRPIVASLAAALKQNFLNMAGTSETEPIQEKEQSIAEKSLVAETEATISKKIVVIAVETEKMETVISTAKPGTSSKKINNGKEMSAKFKEYKCAKCDRSFTTAGSHKRHETACKATAKIILDLDDIIDSDEPQDIDSEQSTTDDEESFIRKRDTSLRTKIKGTFSKRINTLLRQTKTLNTKVRRRKTTCKKCTTKFYKEDGCAKCAKRNSGVTKKVPFGNRQKTRELMETAEADLEEGEEPCEECGEVFSSKEELDGHDCPANIEDEEDVAQEEAKSIAKEEEYKEVCATCDQRFPNKVVLLEHLGTHTGAAEKPIMCGICQKTFSRKYHLDRHLMLTACSGQPPPAHICQVCGKAYTRKDNLREHLRAHAGEVLRRKKYKCEFCVKQFHGTSLLKIHVRTHTGEKPFNCDFCTKCFNSTGALTKHRRIHTGEKPYDCVDCGVSFSLKGTLNRHMRIHTGVRPHKCEYCGKEFIQAGGLKAHMFYHTGENGFKCVDCGKLFNRKARLQMHIRYVHDKVKPFKCSACDKGFTRKEDLMRHSVLHSGDKPHQCPTCQKRFAIKPSLKLHMLTHTKEEPRSCHECGRAFIRKDCLLRHMRKRHRDLLNKILLDEKEAAINNPDSPTSTARILTEQNICDSIRELLSLLVDESTLKGFGWPDKPVDELLESVIKRCGHTPVNAEDYSYMDRLRENSKLLFTVVIDDNAVKTLLNNQTVDEVILHVLRLAKS